jgi:hypothetical protein
MLGGQQDGVLDRFGRRSGGAAPGMDRECEQHRNGQHESADEQH